MRSIQRFGMAFFFGIMSLAGLVAPAQQPMNGPNPPPAEFLSVPQGIPPEMDGGPYPPPQSPPSYGPRPGAPIPAAQVGAPNYDTVSHELDIYQQPASLDQQLVSRQVLIFG